MDPGVCSRRLRVCHLDDASHGRLGVGRRHLQGPVHVGVAEPLERRGVALWAALQSHVGGRLHSHVHCVDAAPAIAAVLGLDVAG